MSSHNDFSFTLIFPLGLWLSDSFAVVLVVVVGVVVSVCCVLLIGSPQLTLTHKRTRAHKLVCPIPSTVPHDALRLIAPVLVTVWGRRRLQTLN